jgi:hypothetical protein
VFRDNRLSTEPHIDTRIGRSKVTLTGDPTLLIVRSDRNLLRNRELITRAIGLMQGGRTLYRAGYFGSELELNFVKQGQVRPLGRIYDNVGELGEFFSKYLAFESSLSGNAGNQHRLAMAYLIDGCAGLPTLEHKVISLFTTLEIIDGSNTLAKNTVQSTLSVPPAEAELIKHVRNALVHEGSTLYQAIEKTRVAMQQCNRVRRMPFRVAGVSKNRVAMSFHFYLLDRLLAYVARKIGMTSPPNSYRARYA